MQLTTIQRAGARLLGLDRFLSKGRYLHPDLVGQLEETDDWLRAWTLDKYKLAMEAMRAAHYPDWRDALDLYDITMLDTHVQSEWASRLLQVLMQPFKIVRADGSLHEELNAFCQKEWYRTYMIHVLSAELYGFSAVQLRMKADLSNVDVQLIPRRHVLPKERIIVPFEGQRQGFVIDDLPNVFLNRNEANPYGLLAAVSQSWIRKKDALIGIKRYGDRAVFPIVALMMGGVYNEDEIKRRQTWMQKMKQAAWGIFSSQDKLETVGGTQVQGYLTFLEQMKFHNEEMSRGLAGQSAMAATQNTPAKVQDKMMGRYTAYDKMSFRTATNDQALAWLSPIFGTGNRHEWLRYDQLDQTELAQLFKTLKEGLGLVPPKEHLEQLFSTSLEEATAPVASTPTHTDGEG